MIKLTLTTGAAKTIALNPRQIVSLSPGERSTLVQTTAGAYSVAQTQDQILTLIEGIKK